MNRTNIVVGAGFSGATIANGFRNVGTRTPFARIGFGKKTDRKENKVSTQTTEMNTAQAIVATVYRNNSLRCL